MLGAFLAGLIAQSTGFHSNLVGFSGNSSLVVRSAEISQAAVCELDCKISRLVV